ncbi:MAG: discoidin domain-containing protein [Alphaproteobacteria bacterium]|nr:discoidin domain-containing protein [Alphaproteobacteria bacterium]
MRHRSPRIGTGARAGLALGLLLSASPALAQMKSSSTGETDAGRHPAALSADGQLSTGWASGGEQGGAGEWLELDLQRKTDLTSVSIWPGNLSQGKRSFREYGRPKTIRVLVDGQEVVGPTRVQDAVQRLDLKLGTADAPVSGRKLRIVIDEVYNGYVFDQTFIAELAVNFPELDRTDATWQTWLDSGAAATAAEKFEAEANEKYAAYKADELGDKEALDFLMDAAAEGEPWLREAARRKVPAGYRVQAVPSSSIARKALRKLKDPTAIPAFEMAALRSTGEDAAFIADTVEIFTAYQELIGGRNNTAPPWGESGFWRGALRGFDEPLPLELDDEGNVWVADTGNNRVVRYRSNGLVDKTWGGAPEITNLWFEAGRPYYPSGAEPGEDPGKFVNPLDIELIPDKKAGTGFAVIDAKNRIQVFDASGQRVAGWTVDAGGLPDDKVGGESYLAWSPKKKRLYAFVEDEGFAYDLQGTEHGKWDIEDGTPTAVEVAKNGDLLLAFRGEVVLYKEGFRHSVVIDDSILGRGFEDLDMDMDPEGRLWVLTDDGVAHRFKKPGKLEFQVPVVDFSLRKQRAAVADGIVFFTFEDQIRQVDAYQKRIDAEAGEGASATGDDLLDLGP